MQRGTPIRGPRLVRPPGLGQALGKDLAVREVAEVVAEHGDAQRRADAIAPGEKLGGLVAKAKMAATADQRVVMAGELRIGGDRRAQVRQRFRKAARA